MNGIRVGLAICLVAAPWLLQGCTAPNMRSCDHFDGTRFHNRASVPDYTLADEIYFLEVLWGSFLIDSPAGRVYFAGDTAYGPHFRRVYETFGAPTVSLLPIGAYEPRWFMYRMHMNPDEAVRAHFELHSQASIGIHFGLIDNAGEGYDAPGNDLIAARREHSIEATAFVVPRYGQVFRY